MYSHTAYITGSTGLLDRIKERYTINKFEIIPCKLTQENSRTVMAEFVLKFNLEIENDKTLEPGFSVMREGEIAYDEAKLFIAWLSTITRGHIDLRHTSFGHGLMFGPSKIIPYDEPISEEELQKVFKIDLDAPAGPYEPVTRPNYGSNIRSGGYVIPADIEKLSNKLYSLREEEQEKMFDACLSYHFGVLNMTLVPSVSLVSLVNCVEGLMRDKVTSGYCHDARRNCPLKYDVMKKFRRFFEDNLQYPLPKEQKAFLNEIYSSRSNFVHNALLGHDDFRGPIYFGMRRDPGFKGQVNKFETILNAAMITWLERL